MFRDPVIIVGAPRSGTSLLHKIVREHPGFFSVAKESDFIWSEYTHPSLRNWVREGCSLEAIDDGVVADIQSCFSRYALSSRAWRSASGANLVRIFRSPWLTPLLRGGYYTVAGVSRMLKLLVRTIENNRRLVDKSVHFPLFLDLVDRVFPDARYIHIVREGGQTVRSMMDGWLNPERFFTYDLPGGLAIPDYPYDRWNFALPPGWQAYRGRPLADVVAFQWSSLQSTVLAHFDGPNEGTRFLRLRLEDLVSDPEPTLDRIGAFIGEPWSGYFERLSRGLPEVNARSGTGKQAAEAHLERRLERLDPEEASRMASINRALGYAN